MEECFIGSRNAFGEVFLPIVNATTFNQVNAATVFDGFFVDTFKNKETFYIIIGSDSGLLALYLKNKDKPSNSRFLFIEPGRILQAISAHLKNINDNEFAITVEENWIEKATEMGLDDYLAFDGVKIIRSLGAIDARVFDYCEIYQRTTREVEQMSWKRKILFAGHCFIEQQLKNLTENQIPASVLKNSALDCTAILLAGGPSLDGILDWVIANRKKLLVVAVSRISQRLLEVGIVPDIIVAIDPTEKMFDVSKKMLVMPPQVLFVSAYHVTSLLPAVWQGLHAYLGTRLPWDSKLNADNLEVVGPTVTNSAFHLLVEMGVKCIILAGVDLCYSQEGYSHAKGSQEYAAGVRIGFMGQRVELNDGSWSETENAFFVAINTLGEQALQAKEKGCHVINYSAKSARIPHVTYTDLKHIEVELTKAVVKENIVNKIQAAAKPYLTDYADCYQELQRVIARLKQVEKLARQTVFLHDKLPDKKILQEIEANENKLKNEHSDLLSLIKMYAYRYFLDLFKYKNILEKEVNNIKKASQCYFQAYAQGAADVLCVIQTCLDRIKNRQEEWSQQPAMQRVIECWKADKQIGRVRVWQKMHADVLPTISSACREQLTQLEHDFCAQLENLAPVVHSDLSDYAQFRDVQHKLYRYYKAMDIAALERMALHLAEVNNPAAKLLENLTRAYVAESTGAFNEAIDFYHACAQDALLETALSHLTDLLIRKGDIENAVYALECLSCVGDQYLPYYAQLCEVAGNVVKAVFIYEGYLAVYTEDYRVWAKVALLYKALSHHAKLNAAIKILEKEPAYCHVVNELTN